jgi:dienelactone hydrolase
MNSRWGRAAGLGAAVCCGSLLMAGSVGAGAQSPTLLPLSAAAARQTLTTSSLHAESINVLDGRVPLRTYVVHPLRKTPSSVVIVVPDKHGITDMMRAVAHQLARAGFTSLLPDLLSGMGPHEGNSDSFATDNDRVRAMEKLPRGEIVRRLQVIYDFGFRLDAVNEKSAAVGFAWGAAQAAAFASAQPALHAVVLADMAATAPKVRPPVLGIDTADSNAWPKALAFLTEQTR